jgi:hypothetical protein
LQVLDQYSHQMSLAGAGNRLALFAINVVPNPTFVSVVIDKGNISLVAQYTTPYIVDTLLPGRPNPVGITKSRAVVSGIWEPDPYPDGEDASMFPVLSYEATTYSPTAVIPAQVAAGWYIFPNYFVSLAT